MSALLPLGKIITVNQHLSKGTKTVKTYHPLRMTLLLTLLCVPGVLALLPATAKMAETLPPGSPSVTVMLIITVVQTTIMLGIFALIGSFLAPKVGFKAPGLTGSLAQTIRQNAPFALIVGILFSALTILLEATLFRSSVPDSLYMLGAKPALFDLVPSLLYGGIAEEIMMRWGLLSLVTWALYRLFQRGKGAVHPAFVWIAVIGAAVAFGFAHLPAVQALVPEVTTGLMIRTVIQNALPGILFGWLFTRRGLESAMLAHMGMHIGMFVLRLIFA